MNFLFMQRRKKLHRKAEKIALAFEYVHDRFFDLPNYSTRFLNLVKVASSIALLIFLIFGTDIWFPIAEQTALSTAQGFREIARILTPKPLPPVTVLSSISEARLQAQESALETWQRQVRRTPVRAFDRVHAAYELSAKDPDLFFRHLVVSVLSPLHRSQAQASEPYRQFTLAAGPLARNTALAFLRDQSGPTATLEVEVELLHALTNFNAVSIPQLLLSAEDRAKALDIYLLQGANLRASGERRYTSLVARRQRATQRTESFTTLSAAEEAKLTAALENFVAARSEGYFEELVAARKNGVLSRAEIGLLQGLETRYFLALNALSSKLNAIEQNRAALIAGVTVTPTPGVDLGIITLPTED